VIGDSKLQPSLLLKRGDQTARTAIMALRQTRLIKLALDLLRETLAQLDTPLIKGVDIPDCALGKCKVLIINDQRAKRSGGNLLRKDTGRRSVAQERFMLQEHLGRILCFQLCFVFADHERFGLSEEIGGKHLLVFVVGDWVVGFGGEDEVRGDQLSALMQELVE